MTLASLVTERRQRIQAAQAEAHARRAQQEAERRADVGSKFEAFCSLNQLQLILDDFHLFLTDADRHLRIHCAVGIGAGGAVTVDGVRVEVEFAPDGQGSLGMFVYETEQMATDHRFLGQQTAIDPGALRMRLIETVDDIAQNAEPKVAARRAALQLARRVVAVAPDFVQAGALWTSRHYEHSLEETQRLWRPFRVWQVRYTAVGGRSQETDGDDLVYEVTTLTRPETLVGSPTSLLEVDRYSGELRTRVIGAMLDATPVKGAGEMPPAVEKAAPFYRSYASGPYWINVPPLVEGRPEVLEIGDLPDFHIWLRTQHGIDVGWDVTATEVAEQGVEALDLERIRPWTAEGRATEAADEKLPF